MTIQDIKATIQDPHTHPYTIKNFKKRTHKVRKKVENKNFHKLKKDLEGTRRQTRHNVDVHRKTLTYFLFSTHPIYDLLR